MYRLPGARPARLRSELAEIDAGRVSDTDDALPWRPDSHEKDAGGDSTPAAHEFAEIPVGGHEDALIGVGELKHGLVGDARREFGYVEDVVAVGPQPGDDG